MMSPEGKAADAMQGMDMSNMNMSEKKINRISHQIIKLSNHPFGLAGIAKCVKTGLKVR